MQLYHSDSEPSVDRPVMLLALSGWVDAASVATDAADFIADQGTVIGWFEPDELFDFRSSRPVLHFRDGDLTEVIWPKLAVVHARLGGCDFIVVHGTEPDYRWHRLSAEFAGLAHRFGVRKLLTLGAVPAMVPHTRPTVEVVATAPDPALLLEDDVILEEDLIVPGAAVSILRVAAVEAGIDTVGYWVRVPHYLNPSYHAGTLSLLDKVARQSGALFDLVELEEAAVGQRADLDRIAENRTEIREYIKKLEEAQSDSTLGEFGDLPSAEELAAEVERYLREAGD